MDPLISIIVPNYQGRKIFPGCIDSLLQQDYENIQIVFVDDGSADGSYDLAVQKYGNNKKVTLLRTKRNSGYVGACNYALKFCKGKYLTVVNNDMLFPSNWVREMYRIVAGKKKIIGGSMLQQEGTDVFFKKFRQGYTGLATVLGIGTAWRKMMPEEKRSGLVHVLAAGIFIIPRDALSDYLFAKDYFAYGEDMELCYRFRMRGYSIVANTKAKMLHMGSYTRKHDKGFNRRAIYHGTKNTIMNFIIFNEGKMFFKMLPVFGARQLALFLLGPRAMWLRVKAYWWVLAHTPEILRRRRLVQRTRTIKDEELMKFYSYKVGNPREASGLSKIAIAVVNSIMYIYCKVLGIRTLDINEKYPRPPFDPLPVDNKIYKRPSNRRTHA